MSVFKAPHVLTIAKLRKTPAFRGHSLAALLCLTAMLASSPAWASYQSGFATLVYLFYAACFVAGAYPVMLLLCWFKLYRHGVATVVHSGLMGLGAGFLVSVAWVDTDGEGFGVAIGLTLMLFLVAVAPALIQYLYFRNKQRKAQRAEMVGDPATLSEIMARKK